MVFIQFWILKPPSTFLKVCKFYMESIHLVVASLRQRNFVASVDLKDAYLHILICLWNLTASLLYCNGREALPIHDLTLWSSIGAAGFHQDASSHVDSVTPTLDSSCGISGWPASASTVCISLQARSLYHNEDIGEIWTESEPLRVIAGSISLTGAPGTHPGWSALKALLSCSSPNFSAHCNHPLLNEHFGSNGGFVRLGVRSSGRLYRQSGCIWILRGIMNAARRSILYTLLLWCVNQSGSQGWR